MISDRMIDQAFSDLHSTCGGVKEDYFGLLYLEKEHGLEREKAINQNAFGGHDYGVDGFHFDEAKKNLYIYQFKKTTSHSQFKGSMQRLISDGLERIFVAPNPDDAKNPIVAQLRSCLLDNRALIQQVILRFVFEGDPAEADRSMVLDKLREDIENKKYLIDQFFEGQKVGLVVEFRSAAGKVGGPKERKQPTAFNLQIESHSRIDGPGGESMYLAFVPLMDLHRMHAALGNRFFDRNIRYSLGENEAVNRAISNALKQVILEKNDDPRAFAFNHNGVTLYVQKIEFEAGACIVSAPRLLNGAQTVTTFGRFLEKNHENPILKQGARERDSIMVLCKIISAADDQFVTRVTINNNRQNPVEPWNLHANDFIQLQLHEKFATDLGIYYERQENAFDQLSVEDLEDFGIVEESKAIKMLKLTQTFLLTDGFVSRLSQMSRIFEDEKLYLQTFREARLRADSRHILLCYKVQFNLRKYGHEIEQKGQNKYWFISRARNLLWALLCQAILNQKDVEAFAEAHGKSLSTAFEYKDRLTHLATTSVKTLLSELLSDREYAPKVAEGNLSFLRTDRAFDRCMDIAHRRWRWVVKKLG